MNILISYWLFALSEKYIYIFFRILKIWPSSRGFSPRPELRNRISGGPEIRATYFFPRISIKPFPPPPPSPPPRGGVSEDRRRRAKYSRVRGNAPVLFSLVRNSLTLSGPRDPEAEQWKFFTGIFYRGSEREKVPSELARSARPRLLNLTEFSRLHSALLNSTGKPAFSRPWASNKLKFRRF